MSPRDDYRDRAVRRYMLTGGRSRPTRAIRPETLVIASGLPASVVAGREQRAVLELHRGALSVAESAAHLGHPVSLVAILVADLVDSGHLTVQSQAAGEDGPSIDLMERLLAGLKSF